MSRKLAINITLLSISIVITLLSIEILFRIKAYYDDKGILTKEIVNPEIPDFGSLVPLHEIVRLNLNDRIIYELKPGLTVQYPYPMNIVNINRLGFRGHEYPMKKTADTVRIIGLGDSVMFGQGVSDEQTYMHILEVLLNKSSDVITYEAINTAVPGYNTAMEVETLKSKGLGFSPDYVLIHFVENDIQLPNFIRKGGDYFSLKKSFFYTWVLYRTHILVSSGRAIKDAPFTQLGKDGLPADFVDDPDMVPDRYRGIVGWKAIESSLGELGLLSKSNDFRVIVIFNYAKGSELKARTLEKAKELGFGILDLEPVFENLLNGQEYLQSGLTVSRSDGHLSAAAHLHVAKALADRILMLDSISGQAD